MGAVVNLILGTLLVVLVTAGEALGLSVGDE